MAGTAVVDETNICDSNERHSAALCAWKEARGEGQEGMAAIIWVIRNRVGYVGFAKTVHDVIYGKNQFTSMSVPSDSQFNLEPEPDDEHWVFAQKAADKILASRLDAIPDGAVAVTTPDDPIATDITKGAHYYANLHTMDKNGWFTRNIVLNRSTRHNITAQIGKHTFFE